MAARSAGLKPSSCQFSSARTSSSVSPALRPPRKLAAIQNAHGVAEEGCRNTITLVRRSTQPGPTRALLDGAQHRLGCALKCMCRDFAGLGLAAGKFPLQGRGLLWRALPYQDLALALENRRHDLNHVNIGA